MIDGLIAGHLMGDASRRVNKTGRVPLEMVEVQSRSYLREDDLVRFEGDYARGGSGRL